MKKQKVQDEKDDWEGSDDCAICRAMKNGTADSMEGLMKAFKETEEEGKGKVGISNKLI